MSEPSPPQELTSYAAKCHCGAVSFTVKVPSLANHKVMSCNCSQCTRSAYLNVYPKPQDVTFHAGHDTMKSYFYQNMGAFKFCPICGSSVLVDAGDGEDIAVNVRMLTDVNVKELKLIHWNGKPNPPLYEVGKPTAGSETPETEGGFTSYPANCHCGAVTFTVRIPTLTDHIINSCSCSICTYNGYLCVYPERKDVIFHTGYDHLRSYFFGDKHGAHKFCPTCGSSVLIDFDGTVNLAINVRMFYDVDPKHFKYTYVDGKTLLTAAGAK